MDKDLLIEKLIKNRSDRELTRGQKEIAKILSGESYNKTKLEIIEVYEDGSIKLKRNRKVYVIKKVCREPKRWDFVYFREEDYQGSWFRENCGNLFLVKKNDGYVHFDDLQGFDCYLNMQHCDTYEVLERY